MVGAGVGAGGYAAVSDNATAAADTSTATAVAASSSRLGVGEIYRKVNAGVVEITATSKGARNESPFPFGDEQSQTQQAQGSGFVYDTDGHAITNYHVVQGSTSLGHSRGRLDVRRDGRRDRSLERSRRARGGSTDRQVAPAVARRLGSRGRR